MNPFKYLSEKIKEKRYKPIQRALYACTAGDHVGKFFVFVNEIPDGGQFKALTFPEMTLLYIREEDVREGIEKKILDLVQILPKDVYETCLKEHEYRENLKNKNEEEKYSELNNRWEQLAPQSPLDKQ